MKLFLRNLLILWNILNALLPNSGAYFFSISCVYFLTMQHAEEYIPKSRKIGIELKLRESKCRNRWYPNYRTTHKLTDEPNSTIVISPHAGFIYSGLISMLAVSRVKKKRIWFFGTSHYEHITGGLAIFPGHYSSSIGKTKFPDDINEDDFKIIGKYLSIEGHRTEEHSIENVLYPVNHFSEQPYAFCGLVRITNEATFNKISDDIAKVWKKDDSIIVSTDWNHFVSIYLIDGLMEDVTGFLKEGKIKELYDKCRRGKYEACGIDSLYLASKILDKVNEKASFEILESTNSSISYPFEYCSSKCVGYIAAKNAK
jgi:AmmeMemoRadiSam system protein B